MLRKILGYDETVGGYVRFWLCTDSQHYMDIARDWYLSDGEWDRLVQLVFLPGYPIVVRLFRISRATASQPGFSFRRCALQARALCCISLCALTWKVRRLCVR